MSLIDMVILGLIREGKKSAYDLVKAMKYRKLDDWISISEPAIYKNMHKLEAKGYLSSSAEIKKTYHITDRGSEYFIELMWKQIKEEKLVYLNFTPMLMNIQFVDREIGNAMLDSLRNEFLNTIKTLESQYAIKQELPPTALALIKLYKDVHTTMFIGLEEFIVAYQKMPSPNGN